MYKNRRNQDPRIINARFKSICPETGKTINTGEQCVYYPSSRKAFHLTSSQASDFRGWQMDIAMGYDY